MKFTLAIILALVSLSGFAQGPFAPQAGMSGTTAMHKDSSVFVAWANQISVKRGKQDIAITNSDTATVGTLPQALGKAKGTEISLGDSGVATLQFEGLIYNGLGPDFAVFENAFNHTFLELAFVEVSSNGVDFYRFPSHSLTDTVLPVGSFGAIQPTNIYNLAGKYTGGFGTPFDLADLDSIPDLDINAISHVRIVDVIGSLDSSYAQRDSKGRKINDQYPTPFPSGGFDLDAVGVVYLKGVGLQKPFNSTQISLYPNPSYGIITVDNSTNEALQFQLQGIDGKKIRSGRVEESSLNFQDVDKGCYVLSIVGSSFMQSTKIILK